MMSFHVEMAPDQTSLLTFSCTQACASDRRTKKSIFRNTVAFCAYKCGTVNGCFSSAGLLGVYLHVKVLDSGPELVLKGSNS